MPRSRGRYLLAPITRRVDALRFLFERFARLLDVLLAQALEACAIRGRAGARARACSPSPSGRSRTIRRAGHQVATRGIPGTRGSRAARAPPACSMRSASPGKLLRSIACDLVDERGCGAVHLHGDAHRRLGHVGRGSRARAPGTRARAIMRWRIDFLALLERREGARREQEHAAQRRLRVARGIAHVAANLVDSISSAASREREQRADRCAASVGSVVDAHARRAALEVARATRARSANALGRVVGQHVVVVVDADGRRRHGILARRHLDELLRSAR